MNIKIQVENKKDTKQPLILLLGNNCFEKKSSSKKNKVEDYEIINLQYLPTLGQIEGLAPDLLIINLQGKRDTYAREYLKLSSDVNQKFGEGLPIVCIATDSAKKNLKGEIFKKVWNPSIEYGKAFEEVDELVKASRNQKKLWSTLNELEKFKQAIYKEFEQASIFQGALFNQAISKTNLHTAYHYLFRKEIGGNYFKVFDLSASHVGILIGDVRGEGAAAALLMGFILGELYSMSSSKDRILWSPSELLARLSESIYSHNKMSELCSSAWYGVLDLTSGKLNYARAGHPSPMYSEGGKGSEAHYIDGGSGFPLGIFPGMTYRDHQIQLPPQAFLLFYTDGLLNQKDRDNQSINSNWLFDHFSEICREDKPVKDIPALVDATFTDLSHGCDPNDDRAILACRIPSVNQSYVKVIPDEVLQESLENEANPSRLNQIEKNYLQLSINQLLETLPKNLEVDVSEEFELAIQELFFKANTQVQRARLIANSQKDLCSAKGFNVSWWLHEDKIDLSIKLDEGSIPWSYVPYPSSEEAAIVEVASSLMFFFDNIQVNSDGLEISMSKVFG
ncbi:MAG: PP2C family protein-serine/threonine phosphatase [Candidatus Caenarcaniphilales bacterium]|nr:PP2C family protein-serine/threonine phosphatase [Candidatus Caenarcaniphilales bacterium]